MNQAAPVHILLVEDDPGDALLAVELLGESKLNNQFAIVGDGEEALEYLRREGQYADARRPDLILLDLNMPRMDGHELLGILKNDEDLRRIPVVVLTTSGSSDDIDAAYAAYANCYITKPIGLDQLAKVVRSIDEFWFSIVRLPSKG